MHATTRLEFQFIGEVARTFLHSENCSMEFIMTTALRIMASFVGLMLCVAVHPAAAATWYVDAAVSSSGNGTSWATAWKSFASISWLAIKPGDTLYISGGPSSQAYHETLTVGASGSSGNPITITKGVDAGHNGTVILDEQISRYNGVALYGINNVTVQNLSIQNITDSGISVKSATAGVTIQNNSVYSGPGLGNGANARGYDVRNSSGAVVRKNNYATPASTTSQTDGIWSSGNDGVVFDGNSIVISNSDPTGHSDGIQSNQDISITIRNNYITHPNGGTNNHGMWLSDSNGTIAIYNNVVYMPVGDEQAITYWNESGYSGKAQMWNNTVYGAHYCYRFISAPNSELKNNICWPASGGTGIVIESSALSTANVDYNLTWAPNAIIGNVIGSAKTWSQWQAFGYDVHGANANPQFANSDFTLLSTSPAINRGATLPAVTTDRIGTPRPKGAAYDIGAYEYKAASQTDTPPPTVPAGLTGAWPSPIPDGSGANSRHEQTFPVAPCGLQASSTAFQTSGTTRP